MVHSIYNGLGGGLSVGAVLVCRKHQPLVGGSGSPAY